MSPRKKKNGREGSMPDQVDPASPAGRKYAEKARRKEIADQLGVPPLTPKAIELTASDNSEHTLPAGFYLLWGGTGSGKSITAAGLVANAYQAGYQAMHWYLYEARGPSPVTPADFFDAFEVITDPVVFEKYVNMQATEIEALTPRERAIREDAIRLNRGGYGSARSADRLKMQTWFAANRKRIKEGEDKPSLIVIDSLSLPLRSFGAIIENKQTIGDSGEKQVIADRSRRGEPTMPGGLQPSDIAFCVEMEEIALSRNMVIVGIINFDLVPFADKLEGMTEGYISVETPGVFEYRQRSSRTVERFNLSEADLDIGRLFLSYDERNYDILTATGIILG